MGAFAQALTQGVGRLGNEFGTAKEGLREQKQGDVFNRLKMLQTVLQLMQLQEQIKQAKGPQPYGTVPTPGGGTSGVTFTPGKGFGTTPLVPGIDKASVSKQLRAWANTSKSAGYKQALEGIANAVDIGLLDPQQAMNHAESMLGAEAGKETEPHTKFKFEPNKGVITGADGKEWSIYDPELPPDLKKIVAAEQRRSDEKEGQKAKDEQRRSDLAMKRALGLLSARDAESASKDARTAKILLDDVNKNIEAAKRGNSKASLALVFATVRTMVQGAGRMTNVEIENELKAGSYGQRMQRWYEQATKGVLPEDQMEFMQEVVRNGYESKRAAGADTWQYATPDKPLPPWLKPSGETEEKQDNLGGDFVPDTPKKPG